MCIEPACRTLARRRRRCSTARGDETRDKLLFNFLYAPPRNVAGEVAGIFVIATDVTEQVCAREQLDGWRRAAETANRAKDEFLAMLGHELRNPLAPIQTALQLMRLGGSEAVERKRTVIQRQVTHLTRLVDDLLDVSRITRGKVVLKRDRVEIADAVGKPSRQPARCSNRVTTSSLLMSRDAA